ncbi:MAG TPA: hypothetical protein VK988_22650 [Acidimicrobiales bacterium]|nr:hypothetical protein [Acidimicrobiales bacterium]
MTNTIREALRVLSRAGWTKDAFSDESGRHCLQGALYESYGLRPFDGRNVGQPLTAEMADDVRLVNEVIEAEFPERTGGVGVSRFNDHPQTTLEDVVRVMEKAAVRKDERV